MRSIWCCYPMRLVTYLTRLDIWTPRLDACHELTPIFSYWKVPTPHHYSQCYEPSSHSCQVVSRCQYQPNRIPIIPTTGRPHYHHHREKSIGLLPLNGNFCAHSHPSPTHPCRCLSSADNSSSQSPLWDHQAASGVHSGFKPSKRFDQLSI